MTKVVRTVRAHSLWVRERQRWRVPESPLYLFFPSNCEVYLSAAPLEGSQSSLTTEDMFSLCENQPLWYAGKMLFFTPNCCLWEASVKNSSSLQSGIDKSNDTKCVLLFFDHSVLCENSKFACVILGVNFPLWNVDVQNVCNTRKQKDFSAEFSYY